MGLLCHFFQSRLDTFIAEQSDGTHQIAHQNVLSHHLKQRMRIEDRVMTTLT